MSLRFYALLLVLALSGCAAPVVRSPVTPTPTVAIVELPAESDVAAWTLTAAEIEYITLFRVAHQRWTPAAAAALAEVAVQYRHDPASLQNNQWRTQAAATADRLAGAYLWFNPASPSDRFDAFEIVMRRAVERSEGDAAVLRSVIDEGDGAQIERIVQGMATTQAELAAIDHVFTLLAGPPD